MEDQETVLIRISTQETIGGLNRPERMASAIGELPRYMRNDIADLVAEEQIPGSFGDLIKRSVGLIEEGKLLEGGNVVSMLGRQRKG
jgi:hypothetical protein